MLSPKEAIAITITNIVLAQELFEYLAKDYLKQANEVIIIRQTISIECKMRCGNLGNTDIGTLYPLVLHSNQYEVSSHHEGFSKKERER